MFLFYKWKVSDFLNYVKKLENDNKTLEQENKMLKNTINQLKEEVRKLKSHSEGLDRGFDQSKLVRQLSDYIELIKPSKPRSALPSQRAPTPARDQLQPSPARGQLQPTPARCHLQPTPASDVDQFICRKGKGGFLKECKIAISVRPFFIC